MLKFIKFDEVSMVKLLESNRKKGTTYEIAFYIIYITFTDISKTTTFG